MIEQGALNEMVEVGCSVASLLDKSTFLTFSWPPHAFVDFAHDAGYEGKLELHPFRIPLDQYVKDHIVSLHQSWRSERNIMEVWSHRKEPIFPAMAMSFILLPELKDSTYALFHLQNEIGRDLPIILYPREDVEEIMAPMVFGEKLFQPNVLTLRQWNSTTMHGFIIEARRRGYTGFCWDTLHGQSLPGWQDGLAIALEEGFVREVHVQAGRKDRNYPGVDSVRDLQDLVVGRGSGGCMQALRMLKEYNWKGLAVTEILSSNLSGDIHQKKQIHREIVNTIQTILA